MLKVLTGMEEPSVAQAVSKLFGGGGDALKECSTFACGELQVEWAVPLGRAVFNYFRTCSCKSRMKNSAGLLKTHT